MTRHEELRIVRRMSIDFIILGGMSAAWKEGADTKPVYEVYCKLVDFVDSAEHYAAVYLTARKMVKNFNY